MMNVCIEVGTDRWRNGALVRECVCIGISEQSTVDTGRPIAHREVRGVVASNWPELQIMYLNKIVFPHCSGLPHGEQYGCRYDLITLCTLSASARPP